MNTLRIMALIISLALILTGCSSAINGSKTAFASEDVDGKITESNLEFAFDIFKEINKNDVDTNVFISPFSISTALAMTYNGAEGETLKEMEQVLHFDGINRDIVNLSYKSLLDYLTSDEEENQTLISNSIWYRQGETIKEDFFDVIEKSYNGKVEGLDFNNSEAADTINKWIEDSTKGKIPKMIEPPISQEVIMYLINAVYFKGEWTKQFKEEDTKEFSFIQYDGSEGTIPMMWMSDKIHYFKGDHYKSVKLPYGDGKVSMYLVLPDEGNDINEFISGFDETEYNKIKDNLVETEDVNLMIPKFKMEYGIRDIVSELKSLGIETLFDERANLENIKEDIYVSSIMHKAVIEVNEKGSEAAGVTVVEVRTTSIREPITFITDRPFLFFIGEEESDTILFMGKYGKVQ